MAVWHALLGGALKLPGVRVGREQFLTTALAPHLSEQVVAQVLLTTPSRAHVARPMIARLSSASIAEHRALATATSTLAGMPGGLWAIGTLPADLTQFFWHVLIVSQKLAYLHGWPELLPPEGEVDEETKLVLTLFVGVVLGVQGSSTGLWKLSSAVSSDSLGKLPQAPLSKFALRNAAIQVARWVGVKLTKRKLSELLGRGVPLVGGAVAGTFTWFALGVGAERLRRELEGLAPAQA